MKRKPTLRIGIIGCGGISHAHVTAYRQAGGARIAQVFDVNRAAAEKLARETGATVADSVAGMAKSDAVDAVSICTPPAFHLENCLPFLRTRIPVLCEKPLDITPVRAARLAKAVRQSRTLFMIAYCHRFHPPVLEAKRILQRGLLGKPLFFRNTFAGKYMLKGNHRANPKISGGGCLADNGAHSVDLFRFLVGEVIAVQAQTARLAQRAAVEDFGLIFLRGRNGCLGEIVSSYSLPGAANEIEVLCANGFLRVSYWVPGQPDLVYRRADQTADQVVDVSAMPDRFTGEVHHFLECVRTGKRPAISAADGLASVRIIAAAYASARTGQPVRLR